MGSIQAAATVSELQVLYDQHQASLDPIATAALLNRLAHTWSGTVKQAQHTRKQQLQQAKRRKQQQQSTLGSSNTAAAMLSARQHRRTAVGVAQPAAAADSYQPAANQAGYEQAVLLLRRLLALCVRHIPRYSSRQLSSALWVVGRFHRAAAAHDDIPQAAAAMLRALLVHQPQQQQQHQQRRRVSDQAAASAPVCLLQRDGNTADLQNVMWAVGRLAQVRATSNCLWSITQWLCGCRCKPCAVVMRLSLGGTCETHVGCQPQLLSMLSFLPLPVHV
jgi:hypothetical protein